MRNIRANVDAVLVGAGTLRSEDLTLTVDEPLAKRRKGRGLEEQPISIILSRSGDIPSNRRIFRESGGGVLVFAGTRAACENFAAGLSELGEPRRNVRTVSGGPTSRPERLLETLASDFGVRRLLVEGGPSVNRSFLEAGLVDELFLTLAPKIVGGDSVSLVSASTPLNTTDASPSPRLRSAYLSDSELYLRYALR